MQIIRQKHSVHTADLLVRLSVVLTALAVCVVVLKLVWSETNLRIASALSALGAYQCTGQELGSVLKLQKNIAP